MIAILCPVRRKSGFTLIELLVVITVIGILAAFLFPVLARAREMARRADCASNMRQVGQAFKMYAQDYDERLPSLMLGPGEEQAMWVTSLRPYYKSGDVTRCKSDTASLPFTVAGTKGPVFNSYAHPWNLNHRLLAEIPSPSTTVLLLENITITTNPAYEAMVVQLGKKSFTPDFGVVWEEPDFRHNETGNYVFADTHVKALKGPNPKFPGYKTTREGVAVCAEGDPVPQ